MFDNETDNNKDATATTTTATTSNNNSADEYAIVSVSEGELIILLSEIYYGMS